LLAKRTENPQTLYSDTVCWIGCSDWSDLLPMMQVAAVTSSHDQQLKQLCTAHAVQQSTSKLTELQNKVSTQEVFIIIIFIFGLLLLLCFS